MRKIIALLGVVTAAVPAHAQTEAAPAAPERTKPPTAARPRPALPP